MDFHADLGQFYLPADIFEHTQTVHYIDQALVSALYMFDSVWLQCPVCALCEEKNIVLFDGSPRTEHVTLLILRFVYLRYPQENISSATLFLCSVFQ